MDQDAKAAEALAAKRPTSSNSFERSDVQRPIPEIPEHQLLKRIGGGSYGEVWLARNVIGTYHAVKIVYRDAFDSERPFDREFEGIQNAMPLSRSVPGLVHILQVGRKDEAGYFYYVMELADDTSPSPEKVGRDVLIAPRRAEDSPPYQPKTLQSELKLRGPLPVEECVQLGLTLTSALAHLHEQGLVHRDIKPSNIIFVRGIPKLADIGLMAGVSAAQSFVGTAGFIPPEGSGSPQADLYSLGKVLYEISTGKDRQDFPELPVELIRSSRREEAPSEKAETSQSLLTSAATNLLELNSIIVKACETDFRKRYQTAQQMHDDLALLKGGHSIKRKRAVERCLGVTKLTGMTLAALSIVAVLSFAVVKTFFATAESRKLGAQSTRSKDPRGTTNQQAYELYQKGRLLGRQGTKESLSQAIENYNRAAELDPNFAEAYLGLAHVYRSSADWHLPPKQVMLEAKKNALKALAIDETLAIGHIEAGWIKLLYDWDWAGAEQEFRRAVELNPNLPLARAAYGELLRSAGRMEEARTQQELALKLNPRGHEAVAGSVRQFILERQYEKAVELALQHANRAPRLVPHQFLLAETYARAGRHVDALAAFEKVRAVDDAPDLMALMGRVHAEMGNRPAAVSMLEELKARSRLVYVSPYYLALIHTALGDKDQALSSLEAACESRSGHILALKRDPHWDSLRAESRFIALLKRIGFQD